MFTVFRYHRGLQPRAWVAEFARLDLACVYAETLAQACQRQVRARWTAAVGQGKPYQPGEWGSILAYAVDPSPTPDTTFRIHHPR